MKISGGKIDRDVLVVFQSTTAHVKESYLVLPMVSYLSSSDRPRRRNGVLVAAVGGPPDRRLARAARVQLVRQPAALLHL